MLFIYNKVSFKKKEDPKPPAHPIIMRCKLLVRGPVIKIEIILTWF